MIRNWTSGSMGGGIGGGGGGGIGGGGGALGVLISGARLVFLVGCGSALRRKQRRRELPPVKNRPRNLQYAKLDISTSPH